MHHYDDPKYDYQAYWKNREYEHESEQLAINRILFSKRFQKCADIGGGFGRLYPILSKYSKQVVLIEPSLKLRNIAKKSFPKLIVKHGFSHHLPVKASTFDLINMVRVSHHLIKLEPTFIEVFRCLKPNGYFLLELANSANFKTRLSHFFTPLPKIPIEKRSPANIRKQTIDFVNHHPDTVFRLLENQGFTIEQVLSVSNLRSQFIKNLIPKKYLLFVESALQPLLAKFLFGPSLFILARKNNN